jgi:hypothetical protein
VARTVQVDLKAGIAGFVPPVEESRKATAGLKNEVQDLDRSLNKIPADAIKAAATLKLLGTEADGTGKKIAGVGDGSTTSMSKLSGAVAAARTEVKRLADEFNRTGNVGVLGQLFSAQKDLKALEGVSKRVAGALEQGAADGGQEAGKTFTAGMQGSLSTPGLGPVLIGVLVAAAVAAAPAMNAALLGTAGLGGIGLGIAGQFQDPEVQGAFVAMGRDLMSTLTADTGAFKQPLIAAAGTFGDALKQALGSVNFGDLAKLIEPLAAGLAGLLGNIMPGLNKMFEAAGPILKAIATDAAFVGNDISTMFGEFARGGKGAQEALRALLMVLGGLAIMVGGLVLGVSKIVEWFVAAGEAVGGFIARFGQLASAVPIIGQLGAKVEGFFAAFNGSNDIDTTAKALSAMGADAALTADDMDKLAGQIGKVTNDAGTLAEAMTTKVLTSMMGLDQANLSVAQSLNQVSDAIKQNGRQLDIHTVKGEANRQAILGAVSANIQQYQALVASGVGAADAAAAYDQNTAALERQLQKAGLTSAQIDGLIGKYRNVPGKVETDIATQGLTDAINGLADLIRELNGLPTRKSVEVFVAVHDAQLQRTQNAMDRLQGNRWGGIYQHAEEGLLSAKVYAPSGPARYAFAEPATGGEAFVPRHGDYGRSTAILDQASRWYGGRFMAAGGISGGGGYSGPATLQLAATFVLPSGEVSHRQLITYALNTGRSPAQLFPADTR